MKPTFHSSASKQTQGTPASNHTHLAFLSHNSHNSASRVSLLGVDAPTLIESKPVIEDSSRKRLSVGSMTLIEKQQVVVDYLKECLKTKAYYLTCGEIFHATGIDLLRPGESSLLEALRSNQRVESYLTEDENDQQVWTFKYEQKHSIANKMQLLQALDQYPYRLSISHIESCYPEIKEDIENLRTSGAIIALFNKERRKEMILYPRGVPFYSKLSCDVKIGMGKLECNLLARPPLDAAAQYDPSPSDLTTEVRRGDAVCLYCDRSPPHMDDLYRGSLCNSSSSCSWFRVSTHAGRAGSKQLVRAEAPASVSSMKDRFIDDRNDYSSPFHSTCGTLPLSSEFFLKDLPRDAEVRASVYKHGCTNDVRSLWQATKSQMAEFSGESGELKLEKRLIELNEIAVAGTKQGGKKIVQVEKEKRKNVKRGRGSNVARSNTHLSGTELGDLIDNTDV